MPSDSHFELDASTGKNLLDLCTRLIADPALLGDRAPTQAGIDLYTTDPTIGTADQFVVRCSFRDGGPRNVVVRLYHRPNPTSVPQCGVTVVGLTPEPSMSCKPIDGGAFVVGTSWLQEGHGPLGGAQLDTAVWNIGVVDYKTSTIDSNEQHYLNTLIRNAGRIVGLSEDTLNRMP